MRRRDFIALIGGVTACPGVVHAQKAVPVIGFLASGSPEMFTDQLTKFRQGLSDTGYTEGRTVGIEYRWAQGRFDRLPELAADLVNLQVAAIAATGGSAPAQAAKGATSKIPIVFTSGDDPIKLGFVAAINHPSGNLTGVSLFTGPLTPKRLELLREIVPNASKIAFLVDPKNPTAEMQQHDAQSAAERLGLQMLMLMAGTEQEIEMAFANLVQQRADALLVGDSPFFVGGRNKLIALAERHAIPAIFQWREYALVGGLISYGTSLAAAYHQMGVYIGRILNGEKPGDLPVVQPSVFELVINQKTARALGVTIPQTVLLRADEVID